MSRQVKTRRKWRAAQGQVPFANNKVMNGVLESFHASVMPGITTDHYLVFFFSFSSSALYFFPNSWLSKGSSKPSTRGGVKRR